MNPNGAATHNTMTFFQNTYRIESTRLKTWDYTSAGLYFVTFVVKRRRCLLGDVVDGQMHLSDYGRIVEEEWLKTAAIRHYVRLHAHVVMPNHVHGIIEIVKHPVVSAPGAHIMSTLHGDPVVSGRKDPAVYVKTPRRGVSDGRGVGGMPYVPETPQRGVFTEGMLPEWETGGGVDRPVTRLMPGSLGSIIGQIRTAATKRIRSSGCSGFMWLPRFHDHIIRNDDEYHKIRQYIINNPRNWDEDRLYGSG